MSDELAAAAAAIRAAIADRPRGSYAAVKALDVSTVGAAIAEGKGTPVTTDLIAGAAGANPKADQDLLVHQYAHHLAQLLTAAGV